MKKELEPSINFKTAVRWIGVAIALSICVLIAGLLADARAQTPASTDQPAAPGTAVPPPSAPAKLSAAELEKLLMPIALYPDPLLATVLPASVYPLEIVQAARFMADTNNLSKVDAQPWDDSVKAVAKIPGALKKLNEDLQWTIQLGEAFLNQDKDVMDTIQALRLKAQKAGTLQTSPQQTVVVTNTVVETKIEQQVVVVTNTVVQIQPSNPQTVYVPTYPPTVYAPPPGYVYDPYTPLLTFTAGVAMGAIIANNCDWHGGGCYWGGGGDVNIDRNTNINIDRGDKTQVNNRNGAGAGKKWQPDANRVRASGSAASTRTMESRGWGSGANGAGGQRAGTAQANARASGPAASQRPASGGARPSATPTAGNRPSTSPSVGNQSRATAPSASSANTRSSAGGASARSSDASAFSGGGGGGASQRASSQRGSASRGGGGARGRWGPGRRRTPMNNVKNFRLFGMTPRFLSVSLLLAATLAFLFAADPTTPAPGGLGFAAPEPAATALRQAVAAKDKSQLLAIFGPQLTDLINPDPVAATNEFLAVARAMSESSRIVDGEQGRKIIEYGADKSLFPVPLVKVNDQWFFDTAAGKEEVINRRIGRNELEALDTIRTYVEAQREYASADRDGDEVLEYAQKFGSTPGQKDGLFWRPDLDGTISPLGPLVAEAEAEGYTKNADQERQPFHGYYFRILTRQGKNAPGGAYDYIINGNMIGGFALVAWPAEYEETGIMTFIVNQQGRVYQKDLGEKTSELAESLNAYDPDSTWARSKE